VQLLKFTTALLLLVTMLNLPLPTKAEDGKLIWLIVCLGNRLNGMCNYVTPPYRSVQACQEAALALPDVSEWRCVVDDF